MGLALEYIDGLTPINEDEKEGLLIETIATKGELDEFEQQNIEEAMQWVFGRKFIAKDVFTEKFICNIHKRMYGDVWAWAGEFRKTDKNIGIDKYPISVALKCSAMMPFFGWKTEPILPKKSQYASNTAL